MRKINIKQIIIAGIMCLMTIPVLRAQSSNTLYYMKNLPMRSELNPAFQPLADWHINLLNVYGGAGFGLGNNSLILKDVIYPKTINGANKTIWVMNDDAKSIHALLDKLKGDNLLVPADVNFQLLSIGFRVNDSYFTLSASEKVTFAGSLPKDMFRLVLLGSDKEVEKFHLGNLAFDASVYTEFALGYSQEINDKFNFGVKAKLLLGDGNLSLKSNKLDVETSRKRWNFDLDVQGNTALPPSLIEYGFDSENRISKIMTYGLSTDILFKPIGIGAAFDVGVSYKMLDNRLELSASGLDLGFIKWKKSVTNVPVNGQYTYSGVDLNKDGGNWDSGLWDAIKDSIHYSSTFNPYTTTLFPKVFAGAEYALVKDKLSIGALSKTTIWNDRLFEEVTASVNFFVGSCFNATVSHSFLNGQLGTIGAGVAGRLGPVNLYVITDYIPYRYTNDKIPIPYEISTFNVQFGLAFTFGNDPKKNWDDDRDGVKNRKDRCPNTPLGYLVDKYGCMIDSDGDGVADNVDLCPNTPPGVKVDRYGCPIDSDGDGVPDYLDQCPDTPAGVVVDDHGCPVDTDGDGVPDYLDKCPDTPEAARGFVDANGCPIDSDGDGVPDYLDKCPDTPVEARGFVDANGCPIDSDGDGVPDYMDKCPFVKGTKENNGCPVVKEAVKQVFEKALQGIEFESGKDVIKKTSFPILDQIVTIMKENPEYWLIINGHTDNVGKPESNQLLSEKRAKSVQNYLIKGGVEGSRMTAKGYGDTQPVVPNTTKANKAKNRRVEFIVKFEKFE